MTPGPRKVGGSDASSRGGGGPLLPTLLLVGGDENQRGMLRDALLEGSRPVDVRAVSHVQELDAYLQERGGVGAPTPSLVLVVLEGRDGEPLHAVERLKRDPAYRRIPVVALARTADAQEIARAYDAGVNTVLPRPVTFLALVRLMKVFTAYWLEAASLPRAAA